MLSINPRMEQELTAVRIRPGLLVALSSGAMMGLGIGINLVPVFLTAFGDSLGGVEGLTKEELGRISASALGGVAGGILLASGVADRTGIKCLIVTGNCLIGASLVVLANVEDYLALCIGLIFLGIGAGILDVVLSPLVAALRPERKAAAMNQLHAYYCLGALLAIGSGAVALRFGGGWSQTCWLLAPLAFIWAAGFTPLTFPRAVIARRRVRVRELVRRGWFRWALVAMALGGATELGIAQWLSSYAELELGYTRWSSGMSLVAFTVAMAVGRILIGTLGRDLPPLSILRWAGVGSCALYVLAASLPWRGPALISCVFLGIAVSAIWPTILGVAGERFPQAGPSMFGALAATGSVGATLMPWLVGWVGHAGSLRWGLVAAALAPLLLVFVVGEMGRDRRGPAVE